MNTFFNRITWVIIVAPAIYLALIWNKLPERVAMHFTLDGTPDRYGSKNELLALIPGLILLSIAIYLLLPRAYKIDPKKTAADNKPRLQKIAAATSIFMSFITCVIIYSTFKGSFKLNIKIVFGSIGLLWCLIGNYFYNIKPNYFAGFRVPWTLNNEENWKKTHRLGGKIFFLGGLLVFITAFIVPQNTLILIFVGVSVLSTIIPFLYSYRLFRKMKNTH